MARHEFWLTRDDEGGPIDIWTQEPTRKDSTRWEGLGHVGRLRVFEQRLFKVEVGALVAVPVILRTP